VLLEQSNLSLNNFDRLKHQSEKLTTVAPLTNLHRILHINKTTVTVMINYAGIILLIMYDNL